LSEFVVITAYTIDTPYEMIVTRLVNSLNTFGIEHKVFPQPDNGDWLENCHHVIEAVHSALHIYSGRNIVWLDADAQVFAPLEFFDTFDGYDLGAHRRKNKKGPGYHWNTGTLFYANNEKVRERVSIMEKEMKAFYSGEAEQYRDVNFMLANHELLGLALGEIPTAYSYIFDTRQPEEINVKPVIVHYQASRRYKNARAKI